MGLEIYLEIIKNHTQSPLYKNSYYLMGNNLLTALVGFIFWIIAARLYSPGEVGISSAIISAMSMISVFALLGFDISIIRFLNEEEDKEGIINSSIILSSICTFLLSILFLSGLGLWSPGLLILKSNKLIALLFIISVVLLSIFTLQLAVFIGFREVKYSFLQSLLNLVKIVLLPLLVALGTIGIFFSFSFFYLLAFFAGMMFIYRIYSDYQLNFKVNWLLVKKMMSYTFENYLANILYSIPFFALPLLVLYVMGPVMSAYFYISWTIAIILLTVPYAVSRSLLAEASHSLDEYGDKIFKSLKFSMLILFLALILIILLGKIILSLYGVDYVIYSWDNLLLFTLASFPFAVVQIYTSKKRVEKEMNPVISVYGLVAILALTLSYLFMQSFGVVGLGYAWLGANLISLIYIAVRR